MEQNSFIVDQKSLLSILSSMQPICTKRTTLDATTSILFQVSYKEVVLKSSDMEISLQASCPLKDSFLREPASFLVSGKRIFELVKELDHDITIRIDDSQIHLAAGNVQLALNTRSEQEFPPFPERIENLMHMQAQTLLDMLNKVAFLIPQNNANPALNGLLFEITDKQLCMTTTDGHCLAQVTTAEYTLPEPKKWLLPRRAIFEVKKILEGSHDTTTFIGTCGNQVVFSGESFNFFTKLLADQFPHYATILDKTSFVPAQVDRSQFIKTLRRSSCLLSGNFIATKFNFHPNQLYVSMENKEVGTLQEQIPLEGFAGEDLNIRFYAPYLLSGLQVFPQDNIQFYLNSASKPIIFESTDNQSHLVYLVMPVAPNHG